VVWRLASVLPAAWLPFRAGVPAIGDGHEPQAAAEVRRADARSRQYGRPDGVARAFQVACHKIEPAVANRSLNLFAKNDCRAALADERKPDGPEMTRVGEGGVST
jgi:hypothetical protein